MVIQFLYRVLQTLRWSFDKVPVLETIVASYSQEGFPSTYQDESSFEFDFEFETNRNLYLDMRDTLLNLKLQIFKKR